MTTSESKKDRQSSVPAESREAALAQAERDTAGFQKKAAKLPTDVPDKVARDTARYEALAREHGANLSEEGFNEALKKVGRAKAANGTEVG